MSYAHSITHDLDASTLLHMRSEGKSNSQIAKVLDCSLDTVYRLIGKQPQEITDRNRLAGRQARKNARKAAQEVAIVPSSAIMKNAVQKPAIEKKVNPLKVLSQKISLQGEVCIYHVDSSTATIELESVGGSKMEIVGNLQADKLDSFIAELQEIKAMVAKVGKESTST